MTNEAIAVKCSLHGPQIVRQRQPSSYTRIHSNYCRPWEKVGIFIMSQLKLITNGRRPVSVKNVLLLTDWSRKRCAIKTTCVRSAIVNMLLVIPRGGKGHA